MRKQAGFTLIELLVVLSIAAILVALAAPSFTATIRRWNMTSAVNTFIADASFARSEGARRGGDVIMCRSTDSEAATPTCATGSGSGWESGWIVYHEADSTQPVNAGGNELLRRQAKSTSNITMVPLVTTNKLTFTATGRLQSLTNGAMSLTFSGSGYSANEERMVCVSVGGRVRIKGDGYTSCP